MHWFPSPALPTRWQLRRSSIKKKGRYSGLAARSLPYPDLSFSMESAPVLFWDFYTGSGCSFKRRGETPYPESHLPFYTLLRFRIGRIARFDTSTYNSFCSTSRSQFLFNCLPIKIAFASGILSIPVTLYVRSVTSKRSHPSRRKIPFCSADISKHTGNYSLQKQDQLLLRLQAGFRQSKIFQI